MKWCTQRWQPGGNNFADLSYLFIYSIFLFLGGWSDTHWQQFVFQLDDNLFSSCHFGVTFCRAQHYVFVIIHCSAAAKRKVIMGYKCMHEGCQKSFESRKGHSVHRQKKLWQAVLRHPVLEPSHFEQCCTCHMLNAQSFIFSPFSTLHIKVQTASFCENSNWEYLWISRKSANYICIHFTAKPPSQIFGENTAKCFAAKIRRNASSFEDFRLYQHYPQ